MIALPYLNLTYADTLPSLGSEPGDISLYDEYAIGKKVFVRIKLSQSYFDYPELEDFIMNRISPILTNQDFIEEQKYSDFQLANKIRLFFIDDPSLNAFALPGNFIGIHKGLVSSVDDHRELLAVFCHELAHLTQRHLSRLYKSQKDSSDIMLLTLLSAIILGVTEPDAAAGTLSLGQTLALKKQMSFSRHAENEADQKGIKYLETLSVSPKYMIQILNRMQQQNALEGIGSGVSWLRTHPLTVDRLAGINGRINNKFQDTITLEIDENEKIFDFLLGMLKKSEIKPLKTKFNSKLEKTFYDFWNAFSDEKYIEAGLLLEELKELKNNSPSSNEAIKDIISLSEIKFFLKTGKPDKADSLIRHFNHDPPVDWLMRVLNRLKLRVLYSSGNVKEFEVIARKAVKLYPKDDWFWKKRASMEFRKGNAAKAHFFVAKGFLAIGNEVGAIEQLTLARSVQSNQQKILKLKIEAELDKLRRSMSSFRSPLG
ncbi:M48 family metalloprotease [Betaproteobacteria bacterium]|nr:M48 family metalloprotease [Betaproteobacteria bacterium]